MSAEWWNLDQALIWVVTRNEDLVQEAGGHPSNERARDGSWLLCRLSAQEIEHEFCHIPQLSIKKTKLIQEMKKISVEEAVIWEGILLDSLARGLVPAIDCSDSFSTVHPAWFIGAYISSGTKKNDDLGRVPIVLLCKSVDGEDPRTGKFHKKPILINSADLCDLFPEQWDAINFSTPMSKPEAVDRGGRPATYNKVLFVSIAAALVHHGSLPKSKAHLTNASLLAYATHRQGGGHPSDEWAKPLIACLWDELKLPKGGER